MKLRHFVRSHLVRSLFLIRVLCLAAFTTLIAAVGCTGTSTSGGPGLEPLPVSSPIQGMEEVEELSELVANRLIEFSDKVRKRDFIGAENFLTDDFLGTRFTGLKAQTTDSLPLESSTTWYDIEPAREVPAHRAEFMESLGALLAPFESVDFVFFKTRGAEFESHKKRGVLRMTVSIIGRGPGRRPLSMYGWAQSEVLLVKTEWQLRRFVLNRFRLTERDAAVFTDVSSSAGVASFGARLGTRGNSSFYWRGAATGDFDGDGRDDIFASTSERVFLYRNRGDGKFDDVTKTSGLKLPAGVTGTLFLDYDADGDQDLFCGYVGWEVDEVPSGESLRLFRNDGKGHFEDVTIDAGLGGMYVNAFSVCAADIDNDGWLDIYICCYNRLDAVYPNSWYRASNGNPNLLLHNLGGKTFEDIAESAGVAGRGWSYAAAFADFDEDGDQDLYLANDYGDNSLFVNDGKLGFRDVAARLGVLDTGNGMGATWGDLDNDGRLDLYVSNMSSSAGNRILSRFKGGPEGSSSKSEGSSGRANATQETLVKLAAGNSIFRQGDEGFERLPAASGGIGASWAWSASILDINLDGYQDIYVANGFISGDSLKDT